MSNNESSRVPSRIVDVRSFDPKAVSVAHQLGSERSSDYVLIADWIKSSGNAALHVDTLVELFDREVGLRCEQSPHPDRAVSHRLGEGL
jgi:hypothetical protein